MRVMRRWCPVADHVMPWGSVHCTGPMIAACSPLPWKEEELSTTSSLQADVRLDSDRKEARFQADLHIRLSLWRLRAWEFDRRCVWPVTCSVHLAELVFRVPGGPPRRFASCPTCGTHRRHHPRGAKRPGNVRAMRLPENGSPSRCHDRGASRDYSPTQGPFGGGELSPPKSRPPKNRRAASRTREVPASPRGSRAIRLLSGRCRGGWGWGAVRPRCARGGSSAKGVTTRPAGDAIHRPRQHLRPIQRTGGIHQTGRPIARGCAVGSRASSRCQRWRGTAARPPPACPGRTQSDTPRSSLASRSVAMRAVLP